MYVSATEGHRRSGSTANGSLLRDETELRCRACRLVMSSCDQPQSKEREGRVKDGRRTYTGTRGNLVSCLSSLLKGFWPAGRAGTMRNVDRTHNVCIAITETSPAPGCKSSLLYSMHRKMGVPVVQR